MLKVKQVKSELNSVQGKLFLDPKRTHAYAMAFLVKYLCSPGCPTQIKKLPVRKTAKTKCYSTVSFSSAEPYYTNLSFSSNGVYLVIENVYQQFRFPRTTPPCMWDTEKLANIKRHCKYKKKRELFKVF